MEKKSFLFTKRTFCFIIAVANLVSFAACKSDRSTEETPRTYAVSSTITKSEGGAASGASVKILKASDNTNAGQPARRPTLRANIRLAAFPQAWINRNKRNPSPFLCPLGHSHQ
jgi:hypothetical protein